MGFFSVYTGFIVNMCRRRSSGKISAQLARAIDLRRCMNIYYQSMHRYLNMIDV